MSLGLVVLEKKLFTRTPTPQSDDIMSCQSADIKNDHVYLAPSGLKWESW